MSGLHHVTFEVPEHLIDDPALGEFFALIEMIEIEPEEEAPWGIRWWRFEGDSDGPLVHVTAAPRYLEAEIGLAHFAVTVSEFAYEDCRESAFCTRDRDGSDRIWLRYLGVRVEVRCEE